MELSGAAGLRSDSDLRSASELRGSGYSDVEVRQLLRAGELTAVRRGVYLRGALPADQRLRHAIAARAAISRLADGAVCSHVTAAVAHGLPSWRIPLVQVQVTRARRTGARRSSAVRMHSAPLDAHEIVEVAGLPVTSVARTLVDLARTVPFEEAVAVADAALYGGLVDLDALGAALIRAQRWPGVPDARRVVAFADVRSESVGESRSRVAMLRAGLPTPVLQWGVFGPAGDLIGRTDFGWPALRTVGEFDGRVKYGRLVPPGQDPGDVVFAEKLREDRLRDQGLSVVRWTWPDLTDFAVVAARLRRRFRD